MSQQPGMLVQTVASAREDGVLAVLDSPAPRAVESSTSKARSIRMFCKVRRADPLNGQVVQDRHLATFSARSDDSRRNHPGNCDVGSALGR